MIKSAVTLAQAVLLATGSLVAVAESPVSAGGLQIDGTLDAISNHELIGAIIAAAPITPFANFNDPAIEPSAAASDWAHEAVSGVDYLVTTTISLGVAYELEEIEELTAQHIEMGTAGEDYASHKVFVRAHWQFDQFDLMP